MVVSKFVPGTTLVRPWLRRGDRKCPSDLNFNFSTRFSLQNCTRNESIIPAAFFQNCSSCFYCRLRYPVGHLKSAFVHPCLKTLMIDLNSGPFLRQDERTFHSCTLHWWVHRLGGSLIQASLSSGKGGGCSTLVTVIFE